MPSARRKREMKIKDQLTEDMMQWFMREKPWAGCPAIVVGNGRSRVNTINLDILRTAPYLHTRIVGCNGFWTEMDPDVLLVSGIYRRQLPRDWAEKKHVISYNGKVARKYFSIWSAGMAGMSMAGLAGSRVIFLVGHDLTPGSHAYRGLPGYNPTGNPSLSTVHGWHERWPKVIDQHQTRYGPSMIYEVWAEGNAGIQGATCISWAEALEIMRDMKDGHDTTHRGPQS